jgi:hypothetical protein
MLLCGGEGGGDGIREKSVGAWESSKGVEAVEFWLGMISEG